MFGPHSTPLRVLLLCSVVVLVHAVVLDVFTGHGPSMLPTFAASGEVFLVEALSSLTLTSSSPSPSSAPLPLSHVLSSLVAPLLRLLFSIRPGDVVLCWNPLKVRTRRVFAGSE